MCSSDIFMILLLLGFQLFLFSFSSSSSFLLLVLFFISFHFILFYFILFFNWQSTIHLSLYTNQRRFCHQLFILHHINTDKLSLYAILTHQSQNFYTYICCYFRFILFGPRAFNDWRVYASFRKKARLSRKQYRHKIQSKHNEPSSLQRQSLYFFSFF